MHPNRLLNLKRANSRGGSLHRRNIKPVPRHEQEKLLQNHFFEPHDVVMITDEIQRQLKSLAIDKKQTFELYQESETIKERMVEEDQAKLKDYRAEKSHFEKINRELDFEAIMLEEA